MALSGLFKLPSLSDRPKGTGPFVHETYAWMDRVQSNGGTLTQAQILNVNQLLSSTASAGLLSKCLYLLPFAGSDLNAILTPAVQRVGSVIATNTSFVIGDATGGGLKGNGTTKRIDTGIDTATAVPTANAQSVLILDAGGTTGNYWGSANYRIGRASSTLWLFRNFRSSNSTPGILTGTPVVPLVLTSERSATDDISTYEGTTQLNTSVAAVVAATGNMYGFALDAAGTTPSSARIGVMALFNSALTNTERSDWVTALGAYRTAMGW